LVFVERQETQTNQNGHVILLARHASIHRGLPSGDEVARVAADGQDLRSVPISPPGPNDSPVDARNGSPNDSIERAKAQHPPQRFFEDIVVGSELEPVVKGPITTTHLVRWAAANGNYARIHWDLPFAQVHQGLQNVVVNGSLKNQYMGQLMVEFAGQSGWFKRFLVQHRGMDYPGDVLTAAGRVTGVREIEGIGYVDCQVGLSNSRGHLTASGQATVALPKRGQELPLIWEVED
jgi:acyl dehydratase